jgi:hypothetical protein
MRSLKKTPTSQQAQRARGSIQHFDPQYILSLVLHRLKHAVTSLIRSGKKQPEQKRTALLHLSNLHVILSTDDSSN